MSASPLRPDLTAFRRRLAELEALMADPATFADNRRAAALGAELRFTSKAVKADDALVALEKELAESRALAGEADAEIRAMAAEEIARLEPAVEVAREQLIRSIIPVNPDDSRNALVEIRAGTGGEEASLFAAELLRAYTRFAEKKGWKCELMSLSHSDLGGVRDAVLLIEGEGATALLRHEAGVHRVQRSRLLDLTRAKEREARADARKTQVGSGDRSERIRTYNFPQNRITDHRIDLTVHGIEQVLEGNLDQLVDALFEADLRERAEAITRPTA